MPLNFYSFLIANMLAEREFDQRNVPNKPRAQQLGLVASVFSPSGGGGGLGSSVVPALLVQQTARREAEAAAASQPTNVISGGGTTGGGGASTASGVTKDEFNALTARVGAMEERLVDYPNVKGRTFADARIQLKEFHILMLDEVFGRPIDDTQQVVFSQIPEAKDGMKLLRGSVVAIAESEPRVGDTP
ncbi:MAG TPA: PASTA domain-containing protein [Pyrinomonadaceae bacterium]